MCLLLQKWEFNQWIFLTFIFQFCSHFLVRFWDKKIKMVEEHYKSFQLPFHGWIRYVYTMSSRHKFSAGFTYRLDRLKPRASKLRGPPAKLYNIFIIVIGISHLCSHNVLYFLNNSSVIFLTQLHSISEYCRILNTPSSSKFAFFNLPSLGVRRPSVNFFIF